MSDLSDYPGKGDLSARSDYDLVLEIMRTIEHYNRDKRTTPDPRSLRDTMLALAALLHIEAIKMNDGIRLSAAEGGEQLREMFASAACCQLDAVAEAAAIIRRNQTGEYQ
jgi:hypothetical protein